MRILGLFLLVVISFLAPAATSVVSTVNAQAPSAQRSLAGLWEARIRFGPDIRGALFIRQTAGTWQAEIAGRAVPVKVDGTAIAFELPEGRGKFLGRFEKGRMKISGHWIQEASAESGLPYASPVVLAKYGANEWRGNVVPIDVTQTFYLKVSARPDGSLAAFLRNPERNLGWFQFRGLDHLERDGNKIKLVAPAKGSEPARVLAEGRYDSASDLLSIDILNRGGTFDFRRVGDAESSYFYPRGRPSVPYRYSPPPALEDGWPVGSLEDVGLSRAAIEKFIQAVTDTPIESANSQEDHAILIARHGKLVLEEYFHGENREKPHDTRSASKSVASDLMGAAILAGVQVSPATLVYQVMNGGRLPADLERRKAALTVEHLLTMSSGLDCDEGDERSPGFEDRMWEQTQYPDFYQWTMALKTVRDPGEKAVYCSAGPNLVGGILRRVSGKWQAELFQDLLAEPLSMKRYYLPLAPSGDYTMTGGARFLPRDFMKLAQLHLNDGTWNGRRIFTPEWSRRAVQPLYTFNYPNAKLGYGYLWWVKEYEYKGKTIRGYFASGNGGQIAMAIPELDLVLAFFAGNYNDKGGTTATNVYVPNYILPAVVK